jgi:pyruvate,water dikinase
MLFAAPRSSATDPVIPALGVAPGRCCGHLRRNHPDLAEADVRGAILLAQRARAEDVGRILSASGTLTLGGALLSHVNLLSRELGKPSVALLPEIRPRLIHEDEPGVLEIGVVPGAPGETLLLEQGDVVLLDGDRGLLRAPGGRDRSLRRSVREMHDALAGYGISPDDESRLRSLVVAASESEPAVLRVFLEAALLYRVVPAGRPARRLVEALLQSSRRGSVEGFLPDLESWIVAQARQRCRRFIANLEFVEDPDELNRRYSALKGAIDQDIGILVSVRSDAERVERALNEAGEASATRVGALRDALGRRVEEALRMPESHVEAELLGLDLLLRHAIEAGVTEELTRRLKERLAGPSERQRVRIGRVLTLDLEDAENGQRALVGGKACGLMRFSRALPGNIRIPGGFVVTSSAYRLHLLGEADQKIRRIIDHGGTEAEVSRLARAAILGAPLPDEVAEAVAAAQEALGTRRLAVRSSATVEDDSESSFAGLFDTALGVDGLDELLDRIRWAWASLWNARALRLLAASGRSPLSANMAVLVQELAITRSAGVMITRDPAGRGETLLVNAAWGLGEAISLGEIPGDLFWVDRRSGETVALRPGRATRRIILDPERRGTLAVDLSPELRSRLCLDDGQLSRLAELARRIDKYETGPMDVEFGFDEEGALVLFQIRRAPAGPVQPVRLPLQPAE